MNKDKNLLSRQRKVLLSLLKQARTNAGLTQSDLAKLLNQPQSFVSKYESGERRIDILELRGICSALNFPIISFLKKLEIELDESKY
jgi:transcriptional regulator with XRE-family HTH domain